VPQSPLNRPAPDKEQDVEDGELVITDE